MYHYLEPYCKVPILAKYKKIACVTVQTPPPPSPSRGQLYTGCSKRSSKGFEENNF